MSLQQMPIYEFGPYRLDAAEHLLLRDGEAVPIQPKIFDLLHALVAHHGHLLEKDELMKLVWPDTVVEEANLANNISILRKTLNGNGERFIETVPKRGYRFVAPVREWKEAAAAKASAQPLPATPGISRQIIWSKRQFVLALLLLIFLLMTAAVAISLWLQ